LTPAPEARRYAGKVAVLCGPACMSSNETFLLMMRAAGAKLIGARTYGSSGNPKPHDLGSGVTLMVPSWEETDAKGQPIEGRGIGPDVAAEFGAAPGDGVIAAAVATLRAP
jgi:C-terminal processing protease CtpA/Prc